MDGKREAVALKKNLLIPALLPIMLILFSCAPETVTDYQAYMAASPERVVLILNSEAESISALDPAGGIVYNNIQTVGWRGTNNAIPSDIMISGDVIHVLLSGQNCSEGYSPENLDYLDSGKHYFENGFNPLVYIPVSGTSWVFVCGFETDEVQPLNLSDPGTIYGYEKSWEDVVLPADSHSESTVTATARNATGDNRDRGSTGGAVYLNGSSSRLYISNVRYDADILLTDGSGEPVEYPADSGKNVRAGGYFRQATISIFSFNADGLTNGASDTGIGLELLKEIDLESLYRSAAGSEYFPGDGLNPQSVFILDGLLNVICTGTNGGTARYYTAEEYIPAGYSIGDLKPGTDPDDGLVIILDISDPDSPSFLRTLPIGGSPEGFREAVDPEWKIVYLAGVGGIQAYRYGASSADYDIISSSSDMILAGDNASSDYFSGLCYDGADDVLYISFYSGDSVRSVNVGGASSSPVFTAGGSWKAGDGPGRMVILE